MSGGILNIGAITPVRLPVAPGKAPCPSCKAKADQRVDGGGFGPRVVLCQACGYEFKESEL
jgi:hypothetical protein